MAPEARVAVSLKIAPEARMAPEARVAVSEKPALTLIQSVPSHTL
jgi:hypothetical protein